MEFISRVLSWLKRHLIPSEENLYRPHALSRDVMVVAVVTVCVVEGFLMASLFLQSSYKQFSAAVIQSALVQLTNVERKGVGASELTVDPLLTAAAQAHASDMAARSYFSHQGPGGEQPWVWISASGYQYAYAGENLATYFYESADVVSAWMASPTHRANIVKPVYKDIGIGIAEGVYQGKQTTFVVQFFGVTKSAVGFTAKPVVATTTTAPVATASTSVAGAATQPAKVAAAPTPTVVAQTPANVPVHVEAAPTPQPIVEGKSTSPVPSSIARYLSSPRTVALSILGSILGFLILALFLASVVRIHIQPVDLLVNGAVVAVFTLSLIAVNVFVLSGSSIPQEPAAAIESISASF